jgi:hypothetical protein
MTTEPSMLRGTSFIATLLRNITRTLREARIRRTKRIALADLLRMPDGRLDEFGINRQDIIEAFDAQRSAKPSLPTPCEAEADLGNAGDAQLRRQGLAI